MKAKWLFIIIGSIIIIGACIGIWFYLQPKPAKPKPQHEQTVKTSNTKQSPSTAAPKAPADIHAADPARLLQSSYSRDLTGTIRWEDSPVNADYRDFNDDSIPDLFVWAVIPGTAGNSFAAVWTTDTNGNPTELWHLEEQFYLGHSKWSIDSNNGLVNTSINADGSTASANIFHWQVTTTGKGFVLEPSM